MRGLLTLAVALALVTAPGALADGGHGGHHHRKQKHVISSTTLISGGLDSMTEVLTSDSTTSLGGDLQTLVSGNGIFSGLLAPQQSLQDTLGSLPGLLGSTQTDVAALVTDAKQNDKTGAKQDVAEIKTDVGRLQAALNGLDATQQKIDAILQNAQESGQLSAHDAALVQALAQRIQRVDETLTNLVKQEHDAMKSIVQNVGGI